MEKKYSPLDYSKVDMDKVKWLCDCMLLEYGKEKQLNQLIQELAELIQAITKLSQKGETNETLHGRNGIFKEGSDVWLMLHQLETIYPDEEMWNFSKEYVIVNACERLKN